MCWFMAYAIREPACRWGEEAAESRGPGIRVLVFSCRCLYRCLCRFRGQRQGDAVDLSFSTTLIHRGPGQLNNNGRTGAVVAETSWRTLPRREAGPSTMPRRSVI